MFSLNWKAKIIWSSVRWEIFHIQHCISFVKHLFIFCFLRCPLSGHDWHRTECEWDEEASYSYGGDWAPVELSSRQADYETPRQPGHHLTRLKTSARDLSESLTLHWLDITWITPVLFVNASLHYTSIIHRLRDICININ